jgi:hypothetical protein
VGRGTNSHQESWPPARLPARTRRRRDARHAEGRRRVRGARQTTRGPPHQAVRGSCRTHVRGGRVCALPARCAAGRPRLPRPLGRPSNSLYTRGRGRGRRSDAPRRLACANRGPPRHTTSGRPESAAHGGAPSETVRGLRARRTKHPRPGRLACPVRAPAPPDRARAWGPCGSGGTCDDALTRTVTNHARAAPRRRADQVTRAAGTGATRPYAQRPPGETHMASALRCDGGASGVQLTVCGGGIPARPGHCRTRSTTTQTGGCGRANGPQIALRSLGAHAESPSTRTALA